MALKKADYACVLLNADLKLSHSAKQFGRPSSASRLFNLEKQNRTVKPPISGHHHQGVRKVTLIECLSFLEIVLVAQLAPNVVSTFK